MVLDLGIIFLRIASLGMVFKMLSGVLSGIVRGYGNTRTPLYSAVIVLIVNVFLDWVLIFGNLGFHEYGIWGSGAAFTLSQIIGFFYMSFYIIIKAKIKIRIKYILFPLKKLKEFMMLCIPTSLEDAAFNVSRLLCLFMIMHNGTTAFASNQIATTIENISFMQGHGFSIAATTLVGFKVGEKNYKLAKSYTYTCAFWGGFTMLICSFFFILIPHFLINQFVSQTESEVINFSAQCLRIASIAQPFMGISLIFAGAMKGSGDTKSPFFISFITSWFIRLPLMYYFIFLLKLPVVYVWWITNIQWCLDGLLMFLMFEKKFKFLRHH
jgi:putative MATE family efflux protein